jgi:hypothetical protein
MPRAVPAARGDFDWRCLRGPDLRFCEYAGHRAGRLRRRCRRSQPAYVYSAPDFADAAPVDIYGNPLAPGPVSVVPIVTSAPVGAPAWQSSLAGCYPDRMRFGGAWHDVRVCD